MEAYKDLTDLKAYTYLHHIYMRFPTVLIDGSEFEIITFTGPSGHETLKVLQAGKLYTGCIYKSIDISTFYLRINEHATLHS